MNAIKKTLVTGGVKSGKSRFALNRAAEGTGEKVFLATAEALDKEMDRKIMRHRQERGRAFVTIEEPVFLAQALNDLKCLPRLIVIDCLTVWMNNLFHHFPDFGKIQEQKRMFLEKLQSLNTDMIIVTNEVGLGVIPDNQLSRHYVDEIGLLNQDVAALCDEVIMVVSGIPQTIKGDRTYAEME